MFSAKSCLRLQTAKSADLATDSANMASFSRSSSQNQNCFVAIMGKINSAIYCSSCLHV